MEGTFECSLDSGEKRIVKKGDVVVQRASMRNNFPLQHNFGCNLANRKLRIDSWRNMSTTEGARMATVVLGIDGAVAGAIEFYQGKTE
jgi:hypothetical protein